MKLLLIGYDSFVLDVVIKNAALAHGAFNRSAYMYRTVIYLRADKTIIYVGDARSRSISFFFSYHS